MTMIDRPVPPPVDRPSPSTKNDPAPWSCGRVVDKDLQRLQELMAAGMGQWEASRLVRPPPPPPVPVVVLPLAITPRPSRSARLLNRWMNREVS